MARKKKPNGSRKKIMKHPSNRKEKRKRGKK
jgi:hypothetical protein